MSEEIRTLVAQAFGLLLEANGADEKAMSARAMLAKALDLAQA